MSEKILFPHAARLAIDAINAELPPGVRAYPKVPKDNAAPGVLKFVVVQAVGGANETFVTATPQLIIEAYAPKDADAYELCDLALAIVRSQDGSIRGARGFGYPQNLPDPTTSQVRYTSTGEVRVWGTVTP